MPHQITRKSSARTPSEGAVRGEAIDRLSVLEITLLTKLLRLPVPHRPTPSWLGGQEKLMKDLPRTLFCSPTGPLQRFIERFQLTKSSGSSKAELCATHKKLSPELIRRLFLQFTAEITTRLQHVTGAPRDALTTRVAAAVKRLQTLHSLWMSEELYRVAFQVTPMDERYERISSGCEACILACVGGNAGILADVRAAALSRKKTGKVVPRIMRLIDGWIAFLDPQTRDAVLMDSDATVTEMRHVRKQLKRARKSSGCNSGKQSVLANTRMTGPRVDIGSSHDNHYPRQQQSLYKEPQVETDHEEQEDNHDYEGSIISHYRRIIPTGSLRRSLLPGSSRSGYLRLKNDRRKNYEIEAEANRIIGTAIHPAFRESLVLPHGEQVDPPPGKDKHSHSHPMSAPSMLASNDHRDRLSDDGTWYSESVHSLDAYSTDPEEKPFPDALRKRAEEEARTQLSGKGTKSKRSSSPTRPSSNRLPDTRIGQRAHYSEGVHGRDADIVPQKGRQPRYHLAAPLSRSVSARQQDRRADYRTQYSESVYSQDADTSQGNGEKQRSRRTPLSRSITHGPQDNPFSRSFSDGQKHRQMKPATPHSVSAYGQDADNPSTVTRPFPVSTRKRADDEARAYQETLRKDERGRVEARSDREQAHRSEARAGRSRNAESMSEAQQRNENRETDWGDFYQR